MSFPSELNFSPDYENVDNYTPTYQFDSVLFPKNAPLLAQDLNELQKVLGTVTSQFNSAIVSDGVIPLSSNWYEYTDSNLKFTGAFNLVYGGKMYYCDLSNCTYAVSSLNSNVYIKLIVKRIIDSNSELYLYGNIIKPQKINNYLKDNFAAFGGKEISNRNITILSDVFIGTEPTDYSLPEDISGSGGTVEYVKIGGFAGTAVFQPNCSLLKIPISQPITEDLFSGIMPVEKGGTGAATPAEAMKNLDTVVYAQSDDGAAYTATIDGITALYVGMKITLKVATTSTSVTPTLNINGLGAKYIRMRSWEASNSYVTNMPASWLSSDGIVQLIYSGTAWFVDSANAPGYQFSTTDLTAGTSPLATGKMYLVYE